MIMFDRRTGDVFMFTNTSKRLGCLVIASLAPVAIGLGPVQAATVNVDLSGASTGTFINGVGANFAQVFLGQTAAGIGITGSPSNPLTLDGSSGLIDVAFWNPGVAPASNSLLSQPDNAAPLSALLSSKANSLAFTSGSADGGTTFKINFYSSSGSLVDTHTLVTTAGYANYSLSGLATFAGFTIFDNTDSAGLRFQNFSYNSVSGGAPEPASWALMLSGFGLIGGTLRSRRKVALTFG